MRLFWWCGFVWTLTKYIMFQKVRLTRLSRINVWVCRHWNIVQIYCTKSGQSAKHQDTRLLTFLNKFYSLIHLINSGSPVSHRFGRLDRGRFPRGEATCAVSSAQCEYGFQWGSPAGSRVIGLLTHAGSRVIETGGSSYQRQRTRSSSKGSRYCCICNACSGSHGMQVIIIIKVSFIRMYI